VRKIFYTAGTYKLVAEKYDPHNLVTNFSQKKSVLSGRFYVDHPSQKMVTFTEEQLALNRSHNTL
jgi:hypothetical protein